MAEPSDRRQGRTRRAAPRRAAPQVPATNATGLRERLRRDTVLFVLCVATLGFVSWACALTWWVSGAVAPLAVAFAALLPAFYLFYLRDA
jgi:Flp pilus assembly protein TadB